VTVTRTPPLTVYTVTFGYDADGQLARRTTWQGTTITQVVVYLGPVYEVNATTGVTTSYYFFGGQRVAMRQGAVVYWLHGDHVGSASLTTSGSGQIVSQQRYKPYGQTRWISGTIPTDRRFTDQRSDSYINMYQLGARWYSPVLGRFISADSIVPDPVNPQALNRYSYVYNRPLNLIDPSGHDPLDTAWMLDFLRANHRLPTDADRRNRLFSLMFRGSGQDGAWTDQDWADYAKDGEAYWRGEQSWKDGSTRQGIGGFVEHMRRLVTHYKEGEERVFVKAVGLIWGGIPLRDRFTASAEFLTGVGATWARNATWPLVEGDANWRPGYTECAVRCDNASHHYAALFYEGFVFGEWGGRFVNWVRDGPLSGNNPPDLALGNVGATHGGMLARGEIQIQEMPHLLRSALDIRSR